MIIIDSLFFMLVLIVTIPIMLLSFFALFLLSVFLGFVTDVYNLVFYYLSYDYIIVLLVRCFLFLFILYYVLLFMGLIGKWLLYLC